MNHYIAFLINGEFNQDYQTRLKEVSDRFRKKGVMFKPRVPHITIKRAFGRDSVDDVQELLEKIVIGKKPIQVKTDGWGHFRKINIHYRISEAQQLDLFHKSLLEQLKSLKGITFNRYDQDPDYHITFMNRNDIGQVFYQAMHYLDRMQLPPQTLTLDTVALVTRPNGHTHKVSKYTFSAL